MVVFHVRNSLIPDGKVVPMTVSLDLEALKQSLPVSFPDFSQPPADEVWLLIVSTTEPDTNGNPIHPEFINLVSLATLHLEIEAAIGRIGQKINWGTPLVDNIAPRVLDMVPPLNQSTNVSIWSDIIAHIVDPLPSAGMDFSTIKVKINGHDVTSNVQVKGSVFDFTLFFNPVRITS